MPPPKKVILVGYSYGSMIANAAAGKHDKIVGFVAVSTPFSVFWALSLFNGSMLRNAAKVNKPKLLIMGSSDAFCGESTFLQQFDDQKEPKTGYFVKDLDHFWFGQEAGAFGAIWTWAQRQVFQQPDTKNAD